MRKNSCISYFLMAGCTLFLNSSCQNRAEVSEEFKPARSELAEDIAEPGGLPPAIEFEK